MKPSYSHTLTLLSAILAFVPVMSVDYMLDGYIRLRETERAQAAVDAITVEAQTAVYEGLRGIQDVMVTAPVLCTDTFVAAMQAEIQSNFSLRQMVVENADGVQYCDAFEGELNYTPISSELTLPGRPETLMVVELANNKYPVLRLTREVGSNYFSAFVHMMPRLSDGLPTGLTGAMMYRMTLADGSPIVTLGDYESFDRRSNDEAFITATSFAGEIPLRSETAMSFAEVRAGYADLDVGFTIVACFMSGGFLLLALQYVRRTQTPAFDLERAIRAGELIPYYQPIIDLKTGKVQGCEVLVRWVKRNGEMVPPSTFIEYAEITGLAIPMTLSLMRQVRDDVAELCQEMPSMRLSFNLFEGHFRDGAIIEDVLAIFGDSPIRFGQLVFEITERHPVISSVQANSVIAGLHAIGARVAMDDVGTGHSNLAYIQTLGVDILKIDRLFISMIKPGSIHVPILDSLIAMARDLGAEIVAEGVETEAQALYLRNHGVRQAQGFLFAPALKAESFIALAHALNGQNTLAKDVGRHVTSQLHTSVGAA